VWDATGPSGRKIRLVNVYGQERIHNQKTGPPRTMAGILAEGSNAIIAGDINAHSPMWNSRRQRRSHHAGFWENLFKNW